MYFRKADGTDPGISGYKSAYKRTDKVVVATDGDDIIKLYAAGYIPMQALPGGDVYYGELRFEFGRHSGLAAVVC